jgi:hypothetical protein
MNAPPGWYSDPEHHGHWRWWSGTKWSSAHKSGGALALPFVVGAAVLTLLATSALSALAFAPTNSDTCYDADSCGVVAVFVVIPLLSLVASALFLAVVHLFVARGLYQLRPSAGGLRRAGDRAAAGAAAGLGLIAPLIALLASGDATGSTKWVAAAIAVNGVATLIAATWEWLALAEPIDSVPDARRRKRASPPQHRTHTA